MRVPLMLRSTSNPGDLRLKSSTSVSTRNRKPSAVWSQTKSIDTAGLGGLEVAARREAMPRAASGA